MQVPLGIAAKDYNAKKSKETLINMMAEANADGSFISVRRTDGLTEYAFLTEGPVRSNMHFNGGYHYVVGGINLFRVSEGQVVEDLGVIGGSGLAQIVSNSVPNNNQILILNGDGDGFIYNNSGLGQITDPDFFPSTSVTVLNERFWFVRDGTNEIFCSEVADGFSYDALSFGTAEWKPDNVIMVVSKKSALWVIGETTTEYFQSFNDTTFPIRPVRGASYERGILNRESFAETSEVFAFLADDNSVQLVQGTEMRKISDLELDLKIRGNGTEQYPGFSQVSVDASFGLFVEKPNHNTFYLTFAEDKYTWGYDVDTGVPHTRKSGDEAWLAKSSSTNKNLILISDRHQGKLWKLDPNARTEGAEVLVCTMRTPSVSFSNDVTISKIVVDMEVGAIEDPAIKPLMMCRYSRDGGYTWINHSPISIGDIGQRRKDVTLRHFGRLPRNKEFVLELSVSQAVRVQFYGLNLYESISF